MRTKRFVFGEWQDDSKVLTVQDIKSLCATAQTRQGEIASYSIGHLFDLFDRVRKIWRDPKSKYRLEAERVLPELTGFSVEMIRLGLNELDALLDPELLQKKLDTELRRVPRGLGYHYRESTKSLLKWYPLGTVYHVLSGNVFLVGPGSLVEGLLTGNVNILKMPSEETFFLPLFIESMIECDFDRVVTRSLAAIEFSSSEFSLNKKDIVNTLKKSVDGIIVWGGEVAVQAYRSELPSKTRLVIFGPKLSFAVVAKSGFEKYDMAHIAGLIAQELAVWDQNACTAPQVCFVQGRENAKRLLEAMPVAMEQVARQIPSGSADGNAAVDIHQLRSLFEIAESRGERAVKHSSNSVDWTILLDNEVTLETSPLNRTLRLVAVEELDEILVGIAPFKNYLQTVGILARADEHLTLSQHLAQAGALKMTLLGEMSGGDIDDPHDGAYDLPQLLNLVVTKWRPPHEGLTPHDIAPPAERRAYGEMRLQRLLREALKTPFYQEKIKEKKISSFKELMSLAPLTREDWESSMAPKTQSLATREASGGYVTRSGGSTGSPKFSFFDETDWAAMCENAVGAFRACGLRAGDRIANFMLAGDLYGSFISFNHVDYLIGATSFAFAGEYSAEGFLEVWQSFNINAIQGLPSVFMVLLRKCKTLNPEFKIEKVMYAGLPMSREDRTWLQDELGVRRVASIIGTTEAGQLAYQCEHQAGTVHHVADDYNHLELLDEKGQPIEAAGIRGRIAVTTLMKTNYPLIRYLIGDAAQWIAGTCPCGRTSPVIEYLGRWDDILSVGLSNLRYSEIRNALEHLPISEMQLHGSFDVKHEKLTIKIESIEEAKRLESQITAVLFEKFHILADQIDKGILAVEIKVVAPGTLERNHRSGKVIAIVDERSKATVIS